MFLATLEGVLYKTVSVQLSSMDCNENLIVRVQTFSMQHIFNAHWFTVLCFLKCIIFYVDI